MEMDQEKLGQFMGKVVTDVGAAMSGVLVVVGERLGLFRALAASGPVTAGELAKRTECAERYVREWLNAMAAGGYLAYDAGSACYSLPPEQAFALADPDSPAFCTGMFQIALAMYAAEERVSKNFRLTTPPLAVTSKLLNFGLIRASIVGRKMYGASTVS